MNHYTFSDFFADFLYVEELRPSWDKTVPLDTLIARHFAALHGNNETTEWKYCKFMAVVIYVTTHIEHFNRDDLAVVGSEAALSKRRLWKPIFGYAIEHDIVNPKDFPVVGYFEKRLENPTEWVKMVLWKLHARNAHMNLMQALNSPLTAEPPLVSARPLLPSETARREVGRKPNDRHAS